MLQQLASHLTLGSLLDALTQLTPHYQILTHWPQGEFHHDLVIRVPAPPPDLPGPFW